MNSKKITAAFLSAILLVSAPAPAMISVSAETNGSYEYSEGHDVLYTVYSDHAEITGCDANSTSFELTIPETIEGLPVTKIGKQAFYMQNQLTSVTLPSSLTEIGDEAFIGCTSITQITIPESVTSIGNSAFYRCKSLETINVPDSVVNLGEYAFYECENLVNIYLGKNIPEIKRSTFIRCRKLRNLDLPDKITSIGEDAFMNCDLLYNPVLPESLTYIGKNVFNECLSITEMVIPENVEMIDAWAFSGCENLKKITILNPSCTIYPAKTTIPYGVVIYAPASSGAYDYAKETGNNFVSTTSPVSSLGDADGSGSVDSKDATVILIDYAKTVLGKASELDTAIADVDKSGKTDSKDATKILIYYANKLLDSGIGTLEEYLNK